MPNENYPNFSLMHKRSWVNVGILIGVSAWMFFLGVLVGRGTAPVKFDIQKLEQHLLTKRLATDKKEMEDLSKNIESGTDETELGFYEALKSSKTDDQLSAIPTKTDVRTEAKPKLKKESKEPTIAAVKPAAGLYTVQVASLRSKDSAQKIANELTKKGYEAFVVSSSSSGAGTWYRVRIGNYKNKSDANSMAQKMKNESFQPIVVRRK